mgnify:CR=1 FL=1
MKRVICIICLFLGLIALATYEVVAVSNVINNLEIQAQQLNSKVKQNKDNLTLLSNNISQIKSNWDKHEHGLFLMFNHKDLSSVTDSLTRLKSYIINNDYDNAVAESDLLLEYAEKNHHIMGFNLQNIL